MAHQLIENSDCRIPLRSSVLDVEQLLRDVAWDGIDSFFDVFCEF